MATGKQEVTVVGGGLVGSLLASLLADRDFAVTVYERQPDLRGRTPAAGRSINLVITRRGIRALQRAGLDQRALELTVPVMGRMMHSTDGELAYQPYGRDESECNYSISRRGLNEFLVREAEGKGARFRFNSRLVDADLGTGRLTFHDEADDRSFDVEAGVIFGADGAYSAVREALSQLDGFDESLELLDHRYKELLIPADDNGRFRIAKNALHIWPRGEFMLMALPNLDGSFTVTLYLPYRGEHGFDSLTEPDQVLALFEEHFADAVPLIPDLTTAFFHNPTGSLGTVRCQPWHYGGRVLLVGDAAHAIVPFFGQGMNAGFEDLSTLAALLEEHGDDAWETVFAETTERRRVNTDAIADMALENFVEMRDRVSDEAFLLRKEVEYRLELVMPRDYRSRYSMVVYSHIPFRVCQEAGEIHRGLLDELCNGLETADDLDLHRARQLVGERLTPFLRERGVSLDY